VAKKGRVDIKGGLHAEDTNQFAKCLNAFDGVSVEKTDDGFATDRADVDRLGNPTEPLFINAAGTPARFLLTLVADSNGVGIVTGNDRLNERPMGPGLDAIAATGGVVQTLELENCLPARIVGHDPTTCDWPVAADISSQFVSSSLLSAARQNPHIGPITVTAIGNTVSRPYIDMTVKMMRDCGLNVEETGAQSWRVIPSEPTSDVIQVEPDASAMSYFLGAAAILGVSVQIEGLGTASSQGDVAFAYCLEKMGCTLDMRENSLTLTGPQDGLTGIDVDMEDIPDTVLTMAVVAAFAKTPTRVTNIANLRVKECDRISAAVTELRRIGVEAEEGADWLRVVPGQSFRPAEIETYDDHRVAMAFSLAGLVVDGIHIKDPDCVAKSFPTYWEVYDSLRRNFHAEDAHA
jgi:3-phosphoshikimate 1-carboxyvinyltransferase